MKYKLRWLQEYFEATREDIVAYQESEGCGFIEAKTNLQPHIDPTLQYFDEGVQDWIEVPTVRISLGKRYA